MERLNEEAARLRAALGETPLGPRFDELYAAQQALAWVIDPENRESPLDMIQRFSNGTHQGSEGCPSELRPVSSE